MEDQFIISTIKLVPENCVNSKWEAFGLNKKATNYCQCGFECKVRVLITRNGHYPYEYVLTVSEYKKYIKREIKELVKL